MQDENKNIIIILLVLALFTGATIELSEGSTIIGVILFIVAAILISRMKLRGEEGLQSSRNFMLIGGFIVAADLIYNYINSSELGTLDSMVFFLGISLIAMGTGKKDLKQLGEFGFYISSVFTGLYLIFYTMFGLLKIDFMHIFDHYFVLMPTVAFIKILGIPIEVVAIETVVLYGAEPMTIMIGGPCSGLYSMFLLMGIVAGYSRIENMGMKRTLSLLGLAVFIAYIANLIRVLILYISAYLYGMDFMLLVHTHIGWMIFAVTAGGIMYIVNRK